MRENFLQAALAANNEIYAALQQGFQKQWQQEYSVGAGGDISSGLDLFCERIFVKHLQKFGKIESEESGVIGVGEATIILDPLDGSSNAYSLFPYFGSSVALIDSSGILQVAIVCNFANAEVFLKQAGHPLQVGNLLTKEFKKECVINPSKIGLFEKSYKHAVIVEKLEQKSLKFRSPGAIALSLAYAHRVNFVLFVGEMRIYDFAAGLALCEDLKVTISQDYAIVAQDIETLNKLEEIIKGE